MTRAFTVVIRPADTCSDLKKYLTQKYPGGGRFKGNPKLHKAGNLYLHTVSGLGTATERMAEIA
jgi:hypothetical protein